MKRSFLVLIVTVLLAPAAVADVVYLVGGGRLEGVITRENEREIVIRLADGSLTIPRERIKTIERDEPAPEPTPGDDPVVPPGDDPPAEDRPDEPAVREQVDRALAGLGAKDGRAQREALRTLEGLAGRVKSHASRRRTAREVIAYLRTEKKPDCYWVSRVLGHYLDAFSPRELVAAVTGKDDDVRLVAASTLGRMPGRAAACALVAFLTDSDARVRSAAVAGLEGRSEAAPELARLVGHPDAKVRARVLTLLLDLTGSDVEGALCRALPEAKEIDRIRIAKRLGELQSRTGFATLSARLSRDPSARVRSTCATALGRIGGVAAKAKLQSALAAERDDSVRSAIEKAIRAAEAD